ncbi:hypothetical protein PR003_g28907 [Phytophthora rubi]|nr:hypothetical protein PR003_g28907 [Phytophthora rubi]
MATYYVNIVPNSTRGMEVPYAVWYREQPPYSRLRTFGCAVLAYIDKVERRKMDSKARETIFVGYSRERRGYRLLDSNTRKAYCSHTVVFHEKKAGRIAKGATPELVSNVSTQQYLGIDSATMETIPSMLDEAHPNERCDSESSAVGSEHQNLPGGADGARSARSGGAAEEARSGGAVATEVAVENTRSGGTVVTVSGGAVVTQKRKRSEGAGSVEVRGTESQEENRSQADHLRGEDVPSPVVRLESLRVLLTLAAVWDYEVHQMDVTTAFLNDKIDVEVYMGQPEGFKVPGKENWVCRLLKSLYGLKQAPRVWFQLLKAFLEEQGFALLKSEACVAVKVIDGQLVFIPSYMDDLILFAPNIKLINEMKRIFIERFEMKDLGELHYILGWEVTRNRQERTIFISQSKYTKTVLERFNMEKCNGCKAPSTADLKLTKGMCAADEYQAIQICRRKYDVFNAGLASRSSLFGS